MPAAITAVLKWLERLLLDRCHARVLGQRGDVFVRDQFGLDDHAGRIAYSLDLPPDRHDRALGQ
jgi:hypothetical protein